MRTRRSLIFAALEPDAESIVKSICDFDIDIREAKYPPGWPNSDKPLIFSLSQDFNPTFQHQGIQSLKFVSRTVSSEKQPENIGHREMVGLTLRGVVPFSSGSVLYLSEFVAPFLFDEIESFWKIIEKCVKRRFKHLRPASHGRRSIYVGPVALAWSQEPHHYIEDQWVEPPFEGIGEYIHNACYNNRGLEIPTFTPPYLSNPDIPASTREPLSGG